MDFIKCTPEMDFTVSSYNYAKAKIKEILGDNIKFRLLISESYSFSECLEIIFTSEIKLETPLERSKILPSYSWILADENFNIIFYSPGA